MTAIGGVLFADWELHVINRREARFNRRA